MVGKGTYIYDKFMSNPVEILRHGNTSLKSFICPLSVITRDELWAFFRIFVLDPDLPSYFGSGCVLPKPPLRGFVLVPPPPKNSGLL